MRRVLVLACAATLAAGACGTGAQLDPAAQPRAGRAGLQLSGSVAGRQVAVSDGAPRLIEGDCDVPDGPDEDVCFVSRDISGTLLVIELENPGALQAGRSLPVRAPSCAGPSACDAVRGSAIVDVGIDVGPRVRAVGGRLSVRVLEPRRRYAGTLSLRLPDGILTGTFDVVPRRD